MPQTNNSQKISVKLDLHKAFRLLVSFHSENVNNITTFVEATELGPRARNEVMLNKETAVNNKDIQVLMALLCAAIYSRDEYIEKITQISTDVNVQNNEGKKALMIAVRNDDLNSSDNLIAAGANVNIQNNDGKPALLLAPDWSDGRLLKLLIRAGADVNIRAYNGDTVIRSILRSPMKLTEKLKLAYSAGASVNRVVVDGNFVVRNREKITEILRVMFVAGENID